MMSRSRAWAAAHPLWLMATALLAVVAASVATLVHSHNPLVTRVLGDRFVNMAAAKADYSLSMSPSSATVTQGTTATYTVTMTPLNGYKGTVALTAPAPSGSGLTTSLSRTSVDSKTTSATLTVGTSAAAGAGPYTIAVAGNDGTTSHSATVSLTVQMPPRSQFTIAASPSSAQVLPGDVAQYAVTVTRGSGFTSAVNLSYSGLPAGTTATFNPGPSLSGSSSTFQVTTSSATPTGTYTIQLSAGAGGTTQQTTVQLVVTDRGKPFSIGGFPGGLLTPGATPAAIDLTLNNPNNQTINVTNLTVSVTGTSAGSACGASNFSVVQYSGGYPLAVGTGTTSLRTLGKADAVLPSVQLVDDGQHNQDACKNVQVFLSYSGLGQG